MKNVEKYKKGYFMPPSKSLNWAEKEYIDEAPMWCSVDLRDGNQALVVPMSLEQKVEFFQFLVQVGFKEIEVGFPAASETEYAFLRKLIEDDLIPDDVTVQVLTQAREHIIEKTFDALKGVKNAVVHVYNSTSVNQREQVFKKSKEEVAQIAENGARWLKEYAEKTPGNFRFEYSPESFTGTEIDYALEVCNRVLDIWQPTADKKVIINLPATVSYSMSHVYASQVEYMCNNLKYRENVVVSLHPHNDRGCGVADAELGVLAGADRIEGTLFGNGERTGNVDIITLAMNMFSQGVDPGLDFSSMQDVVEIYERITQLKVSDRHPYAGKLVFAAFSGSHQDAIAKGMKFREDTCCDVWNVPYLLIDPKDVGREYDGDVIRINSQSGKGGIGYIMETQFGFALPPKMREDFGYKVKDVSDQTHKELSPSEIKDIFYQEYVNIESPVELVKCEFHNGGKYYADVTVKVNGEEKKFTDSGEGRFDAVSNALKANLDINYSGLTYHEHALQVGSTSQAAAYVSVTDAEGKVHWGVGIDQDIMTACTIALIGCINEIKNK